MKKVKEWPWDNFNHELHDKIRKIRLSRFGTSEYPKEWLGQEYGENGLIIDHPLAGRKVKEVGTGKVYNIENVYRQWHYGYYIMIMLEKGGSHAPRYWEVDCIDPNATFPTGTNVLEFFLKECSNNRILYKLIEDEK